MATRTGSWGVSPGSPVRGGDSTDKALTTVEWYDNSPHQSQGLRFHRNSNAEVSTGVPSGRRSQRRPAR